MVKILLLQLWYKLSDPQIERKIRDRISKTGKGRSVFNEIRDQIMAKRIRIRKGTMQDASFIEADNGDYWKPKGNKSKTRRSISATRHIPVNEIKIIEKLAVTSASVHNSQIDLPIPGIVCYRHKRYFCSPCRGIDATMDRSAKGHKLPVQSVRRNLCISRIRSMVEHPYAFCKRMFQFSHVMITTVQRVRVKTYFTAMCYNLMRARFLDRIG